MLTSGVIGSGLSYKSRSFDDDHDCNGDEEKCNLFGPARLAEVDTGVLFGAKGEHGVNVRQAKPSDSNQGGYLLDRQSLAVHEHPLLVLNVKLPCILGTSLDERHLHQRIGFLPGRVRIS